ncbi:glycoside hydrolase family 15 protein [Paenibacillus tarimensis]|uniref:glycoside hydrolase family 15 protein n=1 Tax=Paenibacillus tarimensis TaxID=416012 RepID=UPI001F487250|nr:glycoside hydrolase family 15 protein [Paenibacillus tarimensis]MCF2944903.1 glycoside hydrolase family 15 protein [Paenibacillus tarimensis]
MNSSKPYLIDAVTGNSRFLASLGRTGRMYRLWWPHVNFPQHVEDIRSGLFLEGQTSAITWFDEEQDGWKHEAAYLEGTNIFRVIASSPSCPVEAVTTDYAVPGEDLYVRHFKFTNNSDQPVSFRFLYYSSFRSTESPYYQTTEFDINQDALVHFRHAYVFAVGSSNVCTGYQTGAAWVDAQDGELGGTRIDMSPEGALSWRFADVAPGASVELPVYIAAGSTRDEAHRVLRQAKSRLASEWLNMTQEYWRSYLAAANPAPAEADTVISGLYERSLLAMKLMTDERSGSVVAAPEFDEAFSRCGGYAYCWGRDAAYITTAFDRAGLESLSGRFYAWTLTAQDPDGSWQQRHFPDGRLAPSWGLQIDEGASIIWGMWQHYLHTRSDEFVRLVWPAVERGADFLMTYLDEENGMPLPSHDLWEERIGEHTYSAAAVYGGLTAAASFAELHNAGAKASVWRDAAARIRETIREQCWNSERSSLYRGLKLRVSEPEYSKAAESGVIGSIRTDDKGYVSYWLDHDPVIDISLLGVAVPFGVLAVDDPIMTATADAIEQALTVGTVGGIMRYEGDPYIGGNPWILTTLWLCHYRIRQGRYDEARELLRWAAEHRTLTGLLPEQVDKVTGKTAWVVPLTWSHAMYVLAVTMLSAEGQLGKLQLEEAAV